MPSEQKYWFPAKRYGWGWGIPICWQGWLVLMVFVALLVLGVIVFPPRTNVASFLVYVAILNMLLIAVCWVKGEPPRWRWGDHERE